MEHKENADLSETILGLTEMKISFELIMKLMNSSVADEVFWENMKSSATTQTLRRIKTNYDMLEVSVLWTLLKT